MAQDPGQVLTKWSAGSPRLYAGRAVRPFGGKLNYEGEKLVLRDATGTVPTRWNTGSVFRGRPQAIPFRTTSPATHTPFSW